MSWATRTSSFHGVVITMYYEEHGVPNFHVNYAEHDASDRPRRVARSRRSPLTSTPMTETRLAMGVLPGADLVQRGIDDLRRGHESAEALLVSIGAPRLRSVGIDVPVSIAGPEHKLYLLLARERGNAAHSAYNALIRRLVSFERAAACVR